jgi:hypothetical protein
MSDQEPFRPASAGEPTRAVYLTEEQYGVLRKLVSTAECAALTRSLKGDPPERQEAEIERRLLQSTMDALYAASRPMDDREPEHRPRRGRRSRRPGSERRGA